MESSEGLSPSDGGLGGVPQEWGIQGVEKLLVNALASIIHYCTLFLLHNSRRKED